MPFDLRPEREQAHALLDLLPPAKLGAVRSLLAVMVVDDDEEELTLEDRVAIQVGLASLEKHGTVSMDQVLADVGLTMADFEKMAAEPASLSPAPRNG